MRDRSGLLWHLLHQFVVETFVQFRRRVSGHSHGVAQFCERVGVVVGEVSLGEGCGDGAGEGGEVGGVVCGCGEVECVGVEGVEDDGGGVVGGGVGSWVPACGEGWGCVVVSVGGGFGEVGFPVGGWAVVDVVGEELCGCGGVGECGVGAGVGDVGGG